MQTEPEQAKETYIKKGRKKETERDSDFKRGRERANKGERLDKGAGRFMVV